MWLFIAFLAVPLIEIALFIQIGGFIGLWPTLAIVVLTAILGTWLVRSQGLMAIQRLQGSFERLENPTEALADGAMILIAGALLLTPGFFTDAVGFALLTPPIRSVVFRYLKKRVRVAQFEMGDGTRTRPDPYPPRPASNDIIDGDFTEVTPPKPPNHPGSGWTKH